MKVSVNWLKKYIDLPEATEELADLLTFAGIEVEGIQTIRALPSTVITALVVEATPVPKTDHLKLCKIDIGSYDYEAKDENGLIQVICGAPNCHAGMKAVLALPGSVLGELQIQQAKIRGIVSNGMLCSERELGISENHGGIIELPLNTEIGISINSLYELPDVVYELEITPNRSDLLGYLGIARDLSAKLSRSIKLPEVKKQPKGEGVLKLNLSNTEPEICPRYTARVIQNVCVSESPLWLKNALIKSGLRPINNVVDITNYILLETGQPLHAFDYDKLQGGSDVNGIPEIKIRMAYPKEEFLALDGKAYILDGDELVIADGKQASALAGVMGGEHSGITTNTKNIVLECAAFHSGSIRKTSYKHKLSTDSSYRFERSLSPHHLAEISDRAVDLILQLAGGELCGALLDVYPKPVKDKFIAIRPARFHDLIGFELSGDEVKNYLTRLGFEFIHYGDYIPGIVENRDDIHCHHMEEAKQGITEFTEDVDCRHSLYFRIPNVRVDISREADVIEELARLAGYDKVPQKTAPPRIMDRHAYRINRIMSDWMVDSGAFETLNYSFTDPALMQRLGYEPDALNMIKLINPQSANQSVMRCSLVPQLFTNLAYNLNHSFRDVRLFELGKIYLNSGSGKRPVYRSESETIPNETFGAPDTNVDSESPVLGKIYLKSKVDFVEPKRLAAVFTGKANPEHWSAKPMQLGFSWLKGTFEGLLKQLKLNAIPSPANVPYLMEGESFRYTLGDVEIGLIGRVKPSVLATWGIDTATLKQDVWLLEYDVNAIVAVTRNMQYSYIPIPKFPAVVRDLSFLSPENVSFTEIDECIRSLDTALIQAVELFDEYRSKQIAEGFRSLSLHVSLQDQEKTLTEECIDLAMDSIQKTLMEKFKIKMR